MSQTECVITYLNANFKAIQEDRKLNGFSWKPVIQKIVELYPEVNLDPDNAGHRDRVRNNFLSLRKRQGPGTTTRLETPVVRMVHRNLPREEVKPFIYLDTYNSKPETPKNEQEEFALWKKEKDKLKSQEGMHIVIGCAHLPAHNKEFFSGFLDFVKDSRPVLRGIHLIGDIIDCKSLSQHDSGQISDTTLDEEYFESNIALDQLDEALPKNIEKNYFWGNHEERYARILKKVDISKFGKALMSPTVGCRFVERGYTVQEDYKNAKVQLGKHLDLIHGDYVTQNPTKKHLDVYKKSIMFAHTHKMGAFFDCDKASFNIGWMGDKNNSAFNYVGRIAKSQWQNGFAVVYIDKDGFYHVQLIQWYNGRFVFGTKEYSSHGS